MTRQSQYENKGWTGAHSVEQQQQQQQLLFFVLSHFLVLFIVFITQEQSIQCSFIQPHFHDCHSLLTKQIIPKRPLRLNLVPPSNNIK
jgi:hypothetical protein